MPCLECCIDSNILTKHGILHGNAIYIKVLNTYPRFETLVLPLTVPNCRMGIKFFMIENLPRLHFYKYYLHGTSCMYITLQLKCALIKKANFASFCIPKKLCMIHLLSFSPSLFPSISSPLVLHESSNRAGTRPKPHPGQ